MRRERFINSETIWLLCDVGRLLINEFPKDLDPHLNWFRPVKLQSYWE